MERRSPLSTGVIVGLVLLGLGLALIVVPGLLGADMMAYGYGLAALGVFLLITGLVTAIIYWQYGVAQRQVLAGQNVLAHWQYDPETWRRYAGAEFQREQADKRRLFWITTALLVVTFGGCGILDSEVAGWMAGVGASVIALLAFFAFVLPRVNYRRNLKRVGNVTIATNGIDMNGAFMPWDRLGGRLEGVQLCQQEDPPLLAFEVSYPARTGRQQTTINVPIPPGQEAEAARVLAHFEQAGRQVKS